MLFRFRAQQAEEAGIVSTTGTRRPKNISSQDSIPVCERWRGTVLKDISRKVSKIQDPALSDYMVRDINDELNKLFREKHQWEMRIRDLGGPNYMRGKGRVTDDQGRVVEGAHKGYQYYGRAKELPGVKELFEAATRKPEKEDGRGEQRKQLRQRVDALYYGYNLDEDVGNLLRYEAKRETQDMERQMSEDYAGKGDDWESLPGDAGDGATWNVPAVEDVGQDLLERRKRKMLDSL